MFVTAIVEDDVVIFVAGFRDGEEGDPWLSRRGRVGEGGGAVLGGVEEEFAGAGVLGVGEFAHGVLRF